MLDPNKFFDQLDLNGISFFSGVPDSLLKSLCSVIAQRAKPGNHISAANEGSAVGIAIGHYAATGNVPLVYMQNSGIGNAINPLLSLADPHVMATPLILLVGWRGEMVDTETQLKDEPQHVAQGQLTADLLTTMRIPFEVLDGSAKIDSVIPKIKQAAIERCGPAAFLARRDAFLPIDNGTACIPSIQLSRSDALKQVTQLIGSGPAIIATTGMLSRELFEIRKFSNSNEADLLTVGGMGHAISIAIGVAQAKPYRRVVCLDGDGAALMHMGALTVSANLSNLVHILFNNQSHDSVGGQPTCAPHTSFCNLAKAMGYVHVYEAKDLNEITTLMQTVDQTTGSTFVEIRCKKGSRSGLSRPNLSPEENFNRFSAGLREAYASE
ncbi:MAG: phosphonopyruvate decarboxylase [Rhodospirillaceae bacterium]|nr:phosphonopyruvate decarboxylase [Rhodospirillaceae bacterium]